MAWTNERVQKLTLLWKNGKSASKIAIELGEGVSRNAVIGKIHRLGLSDRSSGTTTIDIKNQPNSIKGYDLKNKLEGFNNVTYINLFDGIVTIHKGYKL